VFLELRISFIIPLKKPVDKFCTTYTYLVYDLSQISVFHEKQASWSAAPSILLSPVFLAYVCARVYLQYASL